MTDTEMMREEPTSAPALDKPFGPVAAAFLAAGIAAVILGILTTLAEASDDIGSALEWIKKVGPLSGKTIISSAAFFVVWAILHPMLRGKELEPRKIFAWTGVLVAIGLVLTFPVFFQLFEPD